MNETVNYINYIVTRAPCNIYYAFTKDINQDLTLIKIINGYEFSTCRFYENDFYILHKSRQAIDELVNLYAMCGGDTTYIGHTVAGNRFRAELLMDCAKLLEAIK